MDQRGTQLTALRWVQVVGVRGSSIHCRLKQVDQRAAEGVAANTIFGTPSVISSLKEMPGYSFTED